MKAKKDETAHNHLLRRRERVEEREREGGVAGRGGKTKRPPEHHDATHVLERAKQKKSNDPLKAVACNIHSRCSLKKKKNASWNGHKYTHESSASVAALTGRCV